MNRLRSYRHWLVVAVMLGASVVAHGEAAAQTVGTFRWQLQPFCNVLTLTVVQSGSNFRVEGVDDLCGGSTRAAAIGMAYPKPDGSIGFGVSIVVDPTATPVHLTASISLASISGTWQDSGGNGGAFVFNPASASGSPRPALTPVFSAGLSAGGYVISGVAAPASPADAANKAYVDSAIAGVPRSGYVIVTSSATVLIASANFAAVTVARPPSYPTGIYCFSGIPPSHPVFGALASAQQQFAGVGVAKVAVVNTAYNAVCGVAGYQLGVYVYDSAGALSNAPFTLSIPY